MENAAQKTVFGILEKDHLQTLRNLEHLYEAIERLRYEGKMRLGRNLARVKELAAYFRSTLLEHMEEEDRMLLPYLSKHIPRLEPVVNLLLMEHRDIRGCLGNLEKSLQCRRPRASRIETICDHGIYLICLLKSHMWLESHNLYTAADTELLPLEKRELIGCILGGKGRTPCAQT